VHGEPTGYKDTLPKDAAVADTHACVLCSVHTLQDLETYKKSAVAVAKKYFTINDIDDFYKKKDARPLMFCHFARSLSDKAYDEVCRAQTALCHIQTCYTKSCLALTLTVLHV
jgi:predicted DNA-binding ArsR family transcriptional regulator